MPPPPKTTFLQAPVEIPHQIRRMVDALLQDGLCQQPRLFVDEGIEQEVRGIREAIDSGAEFPPHSAHSMVEVKQDFIINSWTCCFVMLQGGDTAKANKKTTSTHTFLLRFG